MRQIWFSLGLLVLLVACGAATADKETSKLSEVNLATDSTEIPPKQTDLATLIIDMALLTTRLEALESKSSSEASWDYRPGFAVRVWNAERFGEPAPGSLEEAVRAIHNRLDALELR